MRSGLGAEGREHDAGEREDVGVGEPLLRPGRAALGEAGARVDLASEIELARRYLAIETVRFGARLRVHW